MSNPFNLDQKLKEQAKERPAMSKIVRNRIDATLDSLPESASQMNMESFQAHPSKRVHKPLRRTAGAAVAAGVLGLTVFASGFVSPAMADSLRNIPLIGSLFSSIEADMGLRTAGNEGLTTPVNSSFTYQDVKFKVLETVYDGTRAAFLVHVTAPNLNQGMYDNGKDIVKLSSGVENVFFDVNGSRPDSGLFYSSAGANEPDTLLFEQVIPADHTGAIPDQFEAKVKLKLQGMDHEFELTVPFTKSTTDTHNVQPNSTIENELYTVTVNKAEVTPITTRLTASIALKGEETLSKKEEKQLREIRFAVYDDQGRQLTALSGEGVYQANQLNWENIYATTAKDVKYLIVKPFKVKDDFAEEVKDDQFIKGMEMKIQLP
ncbi:DUF4179 domain-containing protein [Paenibacillus polysaccharolyticus]|uniref:DUF4179 domain-containing protein n=1 Tax=Paenibacillus polysaccharolyticus TaxID=582692 RepID=UPI00209DF1D0|nr:DUF4179 domain-containing protein [Paenibacillus polysaccharolyticus]MCP1136594.1 DUF4179 domain-containing protein [Paenibacillus polysaccharolyticus]